MSTGSTGLIATCASAINAGVSTTQTSNSTGIFPVGSITSTYYSQLQSIVSYFNSELALGQVMSAEGGKLGALVLAGNSITTVGDARSICANAVANASDSDLSCNGIKANVQSTLNTINAGWQSAGASWSQVSGGLLADDAKAGTGSNYIIPPQHVWARDIARFGSHNPTSLESASSSVPPLTSLTPGSGPASSTSLANGETWLGLPFAPATTANLGYLVPVANQPAATTTTPAGKLLGQAGLLNAGQSPTNLILTTGESSPFNISTSTSWNAAPNVCSTLGFTKDNCTGNNPFTSASLAASSFLDTQWGVSPGQNMVIGAPPGSTGTILTMANVMPGASASNNNQLCMTPINGTYKSCGPTTMTANYYLTMPTSGVTNNSNWYQNLGQQNSWTVQLSIGDNYLDQSETTSNERTNILTCPNFVTQAVPSTANSSQQFSCASQPQQNQYSWPVVSLQGTGQPYAAGSTAPLNKCAVTSFTSGTDGNASVGNTCADLFYAWMAGALGVTTGPVSLQTGSVQGTVTPAGNNAAQALLVNQTGSNQQVTLLAGVTSGNAQLAPVVNGLVNGASGSNGVSVKKCSTVGSGIQCDLTIQPGNTALSIPLAGSYSSATLSIALSGNGIYASSNVDLFPYANGVSSLPPAVSNLVATAAPAGSVNSNAGVLYMFADWTAPTATPPVTAYVLTFTSPSGTQSTQTLSASALGSGVNLALPTTQSGTWQVSVAAVNAGGVGQATTTSVTLGTSIPVTPSGLKAVQNANGTLSLTWNPVTSLPALSNYAVQITPPAGNGVSGSAFTVQTSVPSYTVENVVNVGTWNFSLTAVNSLGSSTPANTSLNVVGGALPLPPKAVDLTLGADGWLSVAWQTSDNVPTADSYFLALYAPGATLSSSPLATLQVSSPIQGALVRVPEFYQLAKNSSPGSWFVTVTPASTSGLGQYAVAQLVVTPSVTKQVSKAQADVQVLASASARFIALAKAACIAGNWSYGFGAFGQCVNGVFTQ